MAYVEKQSVTNVTVLLSASKLVSSISAFPSCTLMIWNSLINPSAASDNSEGSETVIVNQTETSQIQMTVITDLLMDLMLTIQAVTMQRIML